MIAMSRNIYDKLLHELSHTEKHFLEGHPQIEEELKKSGQAREYLYLFVYKTIFEEMNKARISGLDLREIPRKFVKIFQDKLDWDTFSLGIYDESMNNLLVITPSRAVGKGKSRTQEQIIRFVQKGRSVGFGINYFAEFIERLERNLPIDGPNGIPKEYCITGRRHELEIADVETEKKTGSLINSEMVRALAIGNKPLGLIWVLDHREYRFDDFDYRLLKDIAISTTNIVEQIVLYQKELKRTAEQKLGQGLRFVSHEMKKPLTAMGGIVHLIHLYINDLLKTKENKEEIKQIKEIYSMLAKELNRMSEISQMVTDFGSPIKPKELIYCNLNEFMSNMQPELQQQRTGLNAEDVKTNYKFTEIPKVCISPERFQLAVENLYRNAIEQLMEKGKEKGEIVFRTGTSEITENNIRTRLEVFRGFKPGQKIVYLDIIDNAGGIEQKDPYKIFELRESTKYGGHGLGLPMTYDIIKRHGGTIEIIDLRKEKSPYDTCFRIYLPVK